MRFRPLLAAALLAISTAPPGVCHAQNTRAGQLGLGGRTAREQHEPTDLSATVKLIVDGTNAFRVEQRLKALKVDSRLTKASEAFAGFMAEHGELSHEADERHPGDRAAAAGYEPAVLAENIADQMKSSGFTPEALAKGFVDGWKESPGHRKNMLISDVTQTGVGVAYSRATDTYYAVQMFGRSKLAEITFRITNKTQSVVTYKTDGQEQSLPAGGTLEHTQNATKDVVFAWPKDKAPANGKKILRPKDGEHWLIQLDAKGRFEVKKEAKPSTKVGPKKLAPPPNGERASDPRPPPGK